MWAKVKSAVLPKVLAEVRIEGTIDAKATAKLAKDLSKIGSDIDRVSTLAVVINSNGGSGSQAGVMNDMIKHFKDKNGVKVYTFTEDMAASAGYMLLCTGDKVYACENSLVGSIGVLWANLSLEKLAKKYKVSEEGIATNDNLWQSRMSLLKDIKKSDEPAVTSMLSDVHQVFIDHVESHRGDRITIDSSKRESEIYNADIWLGDEAKSKGLVDLNSSVAQVFDAEFKPYNMAWINYSKKTPMEKFQNAMGRKMEANIEAHLMAKIAKDYQ